MTASIFDDNKLIWRLQRQLPLSAHGKPSLIAFLQRRGANVRTASRLKVTSVFRTGEACGLMCQFVLEDEPEGRRVFVAPLEQLAFDRRHPIAREIAAFGRGRIPRRRPAGAASSLS